MIVVVLTMNQHHHAAGAHEFRINGKLVSIAPYGSGHINDTFCAVFNQAGVLARFIVQRVNTAIFTNPAALMENVGRVSAHLAAKQAGEPDSARRVLTLIPARDGRAWHVDAEGGYWRAYQFIEGGRSYDAVESAEQAYQAARAFGLFQQLLADLPAPRLHDTIPDFHNTPKRFTAFEQAVAAEAANRAVQARAEDDLTKAGKAIYDFGDLVRTAASSAAEDERDLSKVTMQFSMFKALLRGYLSSAAGFLTRAEKQHLAAAGKLIAFEQGIRFLTDYLAGDIYYKVQRDGQNLDRCRTQFKLVESIEQQEESMNLLINGLLDE